MNPFKRLLPSFKRNNDSLQRKKSTEKDKEKSGFSLPIDDDFHIFNIGSSIGDSYLLHAWVNIAVNILIRNIARADFVIKDGGNDITQGVLFELFSRPNQTLSRYDLWKETAAWWLLEGEAFWWFGSDYSGGIPKEIYILDPRRLRHEAEIYGELDCHFRKSIKRWFYQTGTELIPILSDEIIQFREWNPFNPIRGVNPLISLSLELEQDYYANKANSQLLKNNAIPQGILKTEQSLRPEEADQLERRWESKYGAVKAGRKIAVLGKGTNFEP